jgi:hypothetical protein
VKLLWTVHVDVEIIPVKLLWTVHVDVEIIHMLAVTVNFNKNKLSKVLIFFFIKK